jgi:predicted Zn-dependent peptidase
MSVDRTRLPEIGPDRLFRLPRPARRLLDNGMEARSVEHREAPVLAALLLLPVGSAHDPRELPGLAAMTADLLDEGAAGRDALALHDALARLGAHLAIECTPDATVVGLLTLSRHAEAALQLLAEVCFRPALAPEDFERVRALRRNRLAQMRDVPAATADRVFLSALFGDHPYGHLPIGTEPSLDRMGVGDVVAFHEREYRPETATLVTVGDLSHDEAARLADRVMPRVAPAPRARAGRIVAPVAVPSTHDEVIVVPRSRAQQSELRVGRLGAARVSPHYHRLVVANAVLGGQFTSRINLNLRERKGYTYGARSYFEFRASPGPFIVQAAVQTDASGAALQEVFAEMDGLRGDRPVTARELDLARQGLTRGYARNFETAEQIARAMVQLALHQLPDHTFDEFIARVRAVTADEVTEVARRHFVPAAMLSVLVGDAQRVGPALDALGLRWKTATLESLRA